MNTWVFIEQNNLRTGDRIITEKGPLSRHHSIVVAFPGSVPLIAENLAGRGVQYITLEDFLQRTGSSKMWIQGFPRSEAARDGVVAQINALIGNPNNLVSFNCEHFANLIQNGVAVSKQVDAAILGAAVIGIGLLAFGSNRR